MQRRTWAKLGVYFAAFVILTASASTVQARIGHRVGDMAPGFELNELQGEAVTLDQLRTQGHVLLVFWNTDCSYCFRHIPEYNELHQRYSGRGLTLIGVNVGDKYEERVVSYVKDNSVQYRVLCDAERGQKVAKKFKVVAIPMLVLIAPDGEILYRGHKLPDLTNWIES